MPNECQFSKCRKYRYKLVHDFANPLDFFFTQEPKYAVWIGLNPSIANEGNLDPTLRRIRGFSGAFGGFTGFVMLNLFAWVETKSELLSKQPHPVGEENDSVILEVARRAEFVVCAWGAKGEYQGRGKAVHQMLSAQGVKLMALRFTKNQHPEHPLYLPENLRPVPCPEPP